jgi:hypothetical protein
MLHAELKVLELEEKFVKAKASGNVTDALKVELREARREFRTLREGGDAGEGEARPVPARGGTGVNGKKKASDKGGEN